jgi:hypothetical protein
MGDTEELMFLRYFYECASDFMGPADMDIYDSIKQSFHDNHGYLPVGYFHQEDE